ncbi:MAG: HAMP domain-containing sensor histidine kinase [Deltaproteobacteria bacterium]
MLRSIAAELASLRDGRTLRYGVVSGFAMLLAFVALIAFGVGFGGLPWHPLLGALLLFKLVANTLAWLGVRFDRYALELGAVNVFADGIVMTAAIWVTGDTASPIVAIYTIQVTVLALLTNLTTAVLVGAWTFLLFIVMAIGTHTGMLPRFPTPAEWSGSSGTYVVISILFTAIVIGVPTFHVGLILRRLRDHERRLEARTHALVDANKQKAQFMANVTHELRTPLQGVMGLSELVAKGIYGAVGERHIEAMTNIKGSARRLLALIDDLLLLASDDAGKLEVHMEEVDLADALPSVLATGQWLLADRELTLRQELGALPSITTDRSKLNQIVLNLVANAIKFTPDGGTIVLRARRFGDAIEIEVEDTGIGIPEAELDRIFEEFHQVDGSLSREYGGVGLGLTLVKRLLGLLGGDITVTSTVGSGSTFRVMLPRPRRASSLPA